MLTHLKTGDHKTRIGQQRQYYVVLLRCADTDTKVRSPIPRTAAGVDRGRGNPEFDRVKPKIQKNLKR